MKLWMLVRVDRAISESSLKLLSITHLFYFFLLTNIPKVKPFGIALGLRSLLFINDFSIYFCSSSQYSFLDHSDSQPMKRAELTVELSFSHNLLMYKHFSLNPLRLKNSLKIYLMAYRMSVPSSCCLYLIKSGL